LRRFPEHVRRQDWFAVVLDFVVVVLGIFIALQADQWREDRTFAHAETLYLQRLHEDLSGFVSDSRPTVSFLRENRAGVAHVNQSLAAGKIVDDDSELFERGIIYVAHLPTVTANRSAYDEMVSSGMFARLKSEAVRRAISQLYAAQDGIQTNFSWWRESPLMLERELAAHVDYYAAGETNGTLTVYSLDASEPTRRVRFDFDELARNPAIRNGFYWAEDTHKDWEEKVAGMIESAILADSLVSRELESR
jgi:hypothetical protein